MEKCFALHPCYDKQDSIFRKDTTTMESKPGDLSSRRRAKECISWRTKY